MVARSICRREASMSRCRTYISHIVAVLLLVVACSSGVSLSADGARPKVVLAEDVERIITANTRSLGKLKSASAIVDVSVQTRATAETMFSYRTRNSVWIDGRKTREDSIVTVEPGFPREVAMPNRPDVMLVVPSDSRKLFTGEAVVQTVDHEVVPPFGGAPNAPFGRHGDALRRYARYGPWNDTLECHTRRAATLGYLPTVSETQLDGDSCLLLEWDFRGCVERVWVLPSMGHLIKKSQKFGTKGQLDYERTVELEDYGDGVFWYRNVEDRDWKVDGTLLESISVKVKELRPNVAVDPVLLTLAGMGIPPGP
jgi:hypothetical protein